jgi:histidinol-phosphate aminotransferase
MGMAFASNEIIAFMNKVKPPYNISEPVQELALKALEEIGQVNDMIKEIIALRTDLEQQLDKSDLVLNRFPSDANFLLVKFKDPTAVYNYLLQHEIVVRDRSKVQLCEGCLRITVGTKEENDKLINALKSFKQL